MHEQAQTKPHHSVLGCVHDWWHGAHACWAQLHELDHLVPDKIDRMARDVGISSENFLRVMKQPGGLTYLLGQRLAALKLDAEDIRNLSPLLLADLQRTCACCTEKDRCADDMAVDPNALGWESYCPNSGTLRTLS